MFKLYVLFEPVICKIVSHAFILMNTGHHFVCEFLLAINKKHDFLMCFQETRVMLSYAILLLWQDLKWHVAFILYCLL